MSNNDDWVFDAYDRLVEEKFWGRCIIEMKGGRVTLLRFEKTMLPPKDSDNSTVDE